MTNNIITPYIKDFIKEYVGLIEDDNFADLYTEFDKLMYTRFESPQHTPGYATFTNCLTEILLEANIDPLMYLNYVPKSYLAWTNMTDFKIPAGIEMIDQNAFSNSDLESITIPNTIKAIHKYAFAKCSDLSDIYYDGTMKQWKAIKKESKWLTHQLTDKMLTVHCIDGDLIAREQW